MSFETLAAALIIGLFAIFIVVYTVCLQCCWSNSRCPWFLDKDESPVKDKYTFCPCVQAIQSPDSWQSDLEQGNIVQDPESISHLAWDDPLALIFVNMNVKVVVCDCGKTYKMSPEMARKFYEKSTTKSKAIKMDSPEKNCGRYWNKAKIFWLEKFSAKNIGFCLLCVSWSPFWCLFRDGCVQNQHISIKIVFLFLAKKIGPNFFQGGIKEGNFAPLSWLLLWSIQPRSLKAVSIYSIRFSS